MATPQDSTEHFAMEEVEFEDTVFAGGVVKQNWCDIRAAIGQDAEISVVEVDVAGETYLLDEESGDLLAYQFPHEKAATAPKAYVAWLRLGMLKNTTKGLQRLRTSFLSF
eukprot:483712-Amphidinium_carterae.1